MRNINLSYWTRRLLLVVVLFATVLNVNAAENVLQAIQVDSAKGISHIILKSDENADVKKTVQAPNKMFLDIKGMKASKTINTIYNSASTIDSIVVEETGKDNLRIYIQGKNIDEAKISFDSLKTPLNILEKSSAMPKEEVLLSSPAESYSPVYRDIEDEVSGSEFMNFSTVLSGVKKAMSNEKISWTVTFGLLSILFLSGLKGILNKNQNTRVGLGRSSLASNMERFSDIRDREVDMYRKVNSHNLTNPQSISPSIKSPVGLKAYQKTTRSPYMTTGLPQQRMPLPANESPLKPQSATSPVQTAERKSSDLKPSMKPISKTNMTNPSMNVDSMKFLESMTKIYEKTGRKDLAQGLKSSIKKAQK